MQPRVHLADALSALCTSVFDRPTKARSQRKLDAAALAAFDEKLDAARNSDADGRRSSRLSLPSMPSAFGRRSSMPASCKSMESVGRAPDVLAPPALTNAGEASGLLGHIVQRCRRSTFQRASRAKREGGDGATRGVPDDVRVERAHAATPRKVARADPGPGSPTSVLALGVSAARQSPKSRRAANDLALSAVIAERDAYANVIDRLRSDASRAASERNAASAAVERLHAHATELERLVASRNAALSEKDAALEEKEKETHALRMEIARQRAEHGVLAGELASANEGFRELQRAMRRASGTYSAAKEAVADELEEAKGEVARLREEMETLRAAADAPRSPATGSPRSVAASDVTDAHEPQVPLTRRLSSARAPGRHSPLAEMRARRRQAAEEARKSPTGGLRPRPSGRAGRERASRAVAAARARRLAEGVDAAAAGARGVRAERKSGD